MWIKIRVIRYLKNFYPLLIIVFSIALCWRCPSLFAKYPTLLPILISGILIITNDWLKDLQNQHQQWEKYLVWQILNTSQKHDFSKSWNFSNLPKEVQTPIYELLRDGIIGQNDVGNITLKLNTDPLPERLTRNSDDTSR